MAKDKDKAAPPSDALATAGYRDLAQPSGVTDLSAVGLGKDVDLSQYMEPAPAEGLVLGKSYLFRPGPTSREHGDGKPGFGFTSGQSREERVHCGWTSMTGILMERVIRGKVGKDFGPFPQLVICLTKPAIGVKGKELIFLKPKDIMVITETGALHDLARYAVHPGTTAEVYIKPTGGSTSTPKGWMRDFDKVVLRLISRAAANLPMMPELPPEEDGREDSSLPIEMRG